MDFKKAKQNAKKNSKQATNASSISNMAFMKNAESKKKELLKEKASDLIKQIEEEEALRKEDDSDNEEVSSEDGGNIFNASKKIKKRGPGCQSISR